MLVIIMGPTLSGKSELVRRLCSHAGFSVLPSYTNRFRREDDTIPKFYFNKTSSHYGHQIDPEKFAEVLTEYYALRGWDENGFPRPERLAALGLDYVADDLKARGIM